MRFLDVAGSRNGEFPGKSDDLDTSGRGWTARHRILNLHAGHRSEVAAGSSAKSYGPRAALVLVTCTLKGLTCSTKVQPSAVGERLERRGA